MKILIACEFSQVVTREFRKKGHQAYSCDLRPGEINKEWHIQDNVLNHLNEGWHMMIGHPECTMMCNSGVSWLHKDDNRWEELRKANRFFHKLWECDIPKICLENPIPHKYALLPPYTQKIQPYDFGHGESKATCLWLKNLPKLEKTTNIYDWDDCEYILEDGREQRLHKLPPSPFRNMERSRTYFGIANAMAEQWG